MSINQLHWPGDIDLINVLLKLLTDYNDHIKHQGDFRVFGTYLEKCSKKVMTWSSLKVMNGLTEGEEQNHTVFPHSAASLSASRGSVLYHLYLNVKNALGIQCCRVPLFRVRWSLFISVL